MACMMRGREENEREATNYLTRICLEEGNINVVESAGAFTSRPAINHDRHPSFLPSGRSWLLSVFFSFAGRSPCTFSRGVLDFRFFSLPVSEIFFSSNELSYGRKMCQVSSMLPCIFLISDPSLRDVVSGRVNKRESYSGYPTRLKLEGRNE